jgi:hypothetical protein
MQLEFMENHTNLYLELHPSRAGDFIWNPYTMDKKVYTTADSIIPVFTLAQAIGPYTMPYDMSTCDLSWYKSLYTRI